MSHLSQRFSKPESDDTSCSLPLCQLCDNQWEVPFFAVSAKITLRSPWSWCSYSVGHPLDVDSVSSNNPGFWSSQDSTSFLDKYVLCWRWSLLSPSRDAEQCVSMPLKSEIMASVTAHVNALDFNRNYGSVKRSRDLLTTLSSLMHLFPKQLDEKMAKLRLLALRSQLTSGFSPIAEYRNHPAGGKIHAES